MSFEVPLPVQELLRASVPNFETLEVLLLLHAMPEQAWTMGQLTARVGVDADLIANAVSAVQFAGLASFEDGQPDALVRYHPRDAALAATVGELANIFQEHRTAIIALMNANAIERVRHGAARAFAEAFVIRRKGN